MSTPTTLITQPSAGLRLSIPSISPQSNGLPISPGCPTAGWEPASLRVPKPLGRHGSFPNPSFTPWSSSSQASSASTSPTALASRIEPGTYIAFALSKDAILHNHPKAANVVARFPTKRYLGLVTGSFFYNAEGGELVQELVVVFVSTAASTRLDAASHSLPISPAAGVQPLRTGTLFPFANCRQWATLGTRLLVDNLYKSSLSFALVDEHFDRFEALVNADYDDMRSVFERTGVVDEDPAVQRLRVPEAALPADIWLDIREADPRVDDALKFPDEVHMLEKFVQDAYDYCSE
ncbi:hypothetical protein BV25DRAFT_1830700 [Artomyces pyxidatus]|uniref:Uncharacterized protein n=1 Tax=Artomyces pyxidatus TaxID=48021 RepID=A0ACB8SPX2_9AGAM|nr:hypothetical protein BV25DRAFT_1830700 [Artomyces pyxidatus]